MNRLPLICAAASATISAAILSNTAAAQDAGGDKVNQVIIYGEDPCPVSTGDTITVCARLDESERYRIPQRLRHSDSPDNEAWAKRAQSLEAVGKFGPLSCTPAGAGGDLGCTVEMIEAAYAERASGADIRFSQLINEARDERLEGIDAEAGMTQERVEELERIELERRRRAQNGEVSAPVASEKVEIVDPAKIPPKALPPEEVTVGAN